MGPAKAYKLLKQYGNIDNIFANKEYIGILKDSKTKQFKDNIKNLIKSLVRKQ